ncbi:MAG TPA: hypothetical protein VGB85_11335 [Nannocystis sp.]|jgi:hypothetical protein
MQLRAVLPLSLLSLSLGLASCGPKIPRTTATRESGQSGLMNESFAAQNACNPKNHLRPFIIEWDATDKSSFEAYAASDIVVVRYEGCDMTVLEECRNDSIRGSQGAYKPVEWTSGALEKLDIVNQGELHAKLPLSSATLGGRIAGGEKFHMEYYVSGTRNATRDAVYREDIQSNPGCEGATHFVYGYNLGAFALGSLNELNASAEASIYGFGAGGSTTKSRKADKQGGNLGTCKSDTATEVEGCKAPIRLTLRPIRDGANPQKEAMKAEDTDAALNAAGAVNMKVEMSDMARSHYETAMTKIAARDGKGCLSELDAYDRLEPTRKTTDGKVQMSMFRAQCLMLAGKCDPGKLLLRKNYENGPMASYGPDHIDKAVEGTASQYCQGKMSPRDELLKGLLALNMASVKKMTVAECTEAYEAVRRNKDKVKPKDEDDHQINSLNETFYYAATNCFARAGDCKQARVVFDAHMPPERYAHVTDPKTKAETLTNVFETTASKCKSKPAQ